MGLHERQLTRVFPMPDLDMSPTIANVALPDVGSSANALGLEATTTPRPQGRVVNRRSSNVPDSSPESETGRTAKAPRVRSFGGRASGVPGSPVSPEELITGRRRSKGESSPLGALGLDTSRSALGAPGFAGYSMSATPTRSAGASSSPTSSAPNSPATSSVTSISRRASINLVSPPRPFPPSSSSLSRATGRSSLSAQLASSVPSPFPAAPPPVESIKLQKVPEAVRSAMEFRPQPTTAGGYDAFSLPSSGFAGSQSASALDDIRVPKTPSATRAPSPASGSGSASHASSVRTGPPSQSSSRAQSRPGSRPASRQPSREDVRAAVASGSTSPPFSSSPPVSSSAFSPLFPFPSAGPSSPGPSRSRAKSVYQPPAGPFSSTSMSPSSASPFSAASQPGDMGVSPLTLGLSPLAEATAAESAFESGMRRKSSLRQPGSGANTMSMHRTSVAPSGALLTPDQRIGTSRGGESTSEYAQIILASRNAKMRKWKSSVGSFGSGHDRSSSWAGEGGLPATATGGQESRERGTTFTRAEDDSGAADAVGFGIGVGNKEFEWVDWLDEYRKMKEAKLRAEQQSRPARARQTSDEKQEPSASTSSQTSPSIGRGRSSEFRRVGNQY